MTIGSELVAAREKIAAMETNETAMVETLNGLKKQVADLQTAALTADAKAKADLEAVRVELAKAKEVAEAAGKERDSVKQELAAAKATLSLAPFVDVVVGGKPVELGSPQAGQPAVDVIALVESKRGTPEYLKLYREHKAEYDAEFRKRQGK